MLELLQQITTYGQLQQQTFIPHGPGSRESEIQVGLREKSEIQVGPRLVSCEISLLGV